MLSGDKCKKWHPYCYTLARVLVGLLFFMHGASKFGFGGEAVSGTLFVSAGIIELVVGLSLVLGLWTRLTTLVGAVEMGVAFFYAHVSSGWNPLTNGGEAAVLFFAVFLLLHIHGNGSCCSLEKLIWKKERF